MKKKFSGNDELTFLCIFFAMISTARTERLSCARLAGHHWTEEEDKMKRAKMFGPKLTRWKGRWMTTAAMTTHKFSRKAGEDDLEDSWTKVKQIKSWQKWQECWDTGETGCNVDDHEFRQGTGRNQRLKIRRRNDERNVNEIKRRAKVNQLHWSYGRGGVGDKEEDDADDTIDEVRAVSRWPAFERLQIFKTCKCVCVQSEQWKLNECEPTSVKSAYSPTTHTHNMLSRNEMSRRRCSFSRFFMLPQLAFVIGRRNEQNGSWRPMREKNKKKCESSGQSRLFFLLTIFFCFSIPSRARACVWLCVVFRAGIYMKMR